MQADDIGAKRLEEACAPRDGGLRGGVHNALSTKQLRNRHERVCELTTSARSDWRKHAYPEMAVDEGEFISHAHNQAAQKPARAGVRADDIGAKRLEEACIPRDGGL